MPDDDQPPGSETPATLAEQRLMEAAALDDRVLDLSDLSEPESAVRATFLRGILLGPDSACRRASFRGGRISGVLDLEACVLHGALKFDHVEFDGEVVLRRARASRLEFAECTMPRLTAPRLTLDHALVLQGSTIEEGLALDGAAIPAGLDCRGVSIHSNGLSFVRGTAGEARLADGFNCCGTVQVQGTVIAGRLDCSRARFDAPPLAFSFAGGRAADVLMAEVTCEGEVDLSDCVIGDVLCTGEFNNPEGDALDLSGTEARRVMLGGSEHPIRCRGSIDMTAGRLASLSGGPGQMERVAGDALGLARVEVAGNVLLQDLDVAGTVNLSYASIGGLLLWRHLHVRWEDAPVELAAVPTVSMAVGDFFIEGGSEIVGGVALIQVSVDGRLSIRESAFVKPTGIALGVSQCTVGRALQFVDVRVDGGLLLADTDAQTLADDLGTGPDRFGSWSAPSSLSLDGFTYSQFGEGAVWDDGLRHAWLKRTLAYEPSAWHQLAETYRRSGWDREATRTAIAMQNDRLARGRLPLHRRLGRRVLGLTIGTAIGRASPGCGRWPSSPHSPLWFPSNETVSNPSVNPGGIFSP